jgi:hypothetical protein
MDEPFTHEDVKQRATDDYGMDFSDSEIERGFKKLKKLGMIELERCDKTIDMFEGDL